MRILAITATLNQRSGWGRYSRAVIEELMAQGMEVMVCTEDISDAPYTVSKILSVTARYSLIQFFRNIFIIRNAARRTQVVHAFDGWPYAIYGWIAVLGTSKKLFVTGVATYSVPPTESSIKGFLFKLAYRRSSKILCVSKYTEERIRAAGISKGLVVVPMGVTPLPSIPEAEYRGILEGYKIAPETYPVLLTVGEVKNRKGQLETLRGVRELLSLYPNIVYIMVGKRNEGYVEEIFDYVEQNAMKDHVLLVHDANDRTLACLYRRSDVVTLTAVSDPKSRHFEGFGLSIIEGYQFGKPAIGNVGSGVRDAIEDGQTGFHTVQDSPHSVAEKIILILKDYQRLSANALHTYSRYSWQRTVGEYISYYRRALNKDSD